MTTTTLTLAAFLAERLDEDEAAALAATPGGWHHSDAHGSCVVTADRQSMIADLSPEGGSWRGQWSDAAHIARHDPARVLAEIASKRAMIECHKSWPVLMEGLPTFERVDGDMDSIAFRASQQIQWLTEQEYRARFGDEPPTAPMLRILAAVYADREDYDPSWAVS